MSARRQRAVRRSAIVCVRLWTTGGRQEEQAVDEESIDPGIETSITDEVDSDLDLIAGKTKGSGYIEQDN
jgi:hypothetical protein